MASENEMLRIKVLRITPYLLLLAGALLFLPYPVIYALKAILRASGARSFSPENAFILFLSIGHIVLCLPLFSITASSIWLWRRTDSHDEKFHVLNRGFLRYLPALSLGLIQLFYSIKSGNFFIPGIFGVLLIVYAWILLKLDAPPVES